MCFMCMISVPLNYFSRTNKTTYAPCVCVCKRAYLRSGSKNVIAQVRDVCLSLALISSMCQCHTVHKLKQFLEYRVQFYLKNVFIGKTHAKITE